MFDFMNLFISKAMAADGVAPAVDAAMPANGGDAQSTLMRFMPLFLIFGVFYFLLIRPQQKKMEAQADMLKALKKGDKVITSGGTVGVIVKLDDDYAMIEIAKGVEIKQVRATISGLVDDKHSIANENKNK